MSNKAKRVQIIHQTSIGENGFRFQERLDIGVFEVVHIHNKAAKKKQDVEEFNDKEEAAKYLQQLMDDTWNKVYRFNNN